MLIGILAVTSSSFIILAAYEPSGAQVDRVSLAFVRVLFTALLSLTIVWIRRSKTHKLVKHTYSKKDFLVISSSGLALALHFSFWFISLDYLPIGVSLALTNTAPIWILAFMFIFYREVQKVKQVIGVLVGVGGAVVLSVNNLTLFLDKGLSLGALLALISAFGLAIYLALAKYGVDKFGLWLYFGQVNLVAAVGLYIYLTISGNLSHVSLMAITYGLSLALIPGLLGHASFQYSMSKLPSSLVSIATLGEPLLGALFAWFIFSQKLSFVEVVGMLLIPMGVFLTLNFNGDSPINYEDQ